MPTTTSINRDTTLCLSLAASARRGNGLRGGGDARADTAGPGGVGNRQEGHHRRAGDRVAGRGTVRALPVCGPPMRRQPKPPSSRARDSSVTEMARQGVSRRPAPAGAASSGRGSLDTWCPATGDVVGARSKGSLAAWRISRRRHLLAPRRIGWVWPCVLPGVRGVGQLGS